MTEPQTDDWVPVGAASAAADDWTPVAAAPVSTASDVGSAAASGAAKDASYLVNPMGLVRDIARPVVQGATRLAGAAYTGMGGDLSPETAEYLTNPMPPTDTDKAINAMLPNYQPQTGLGKATKTAVEALPMVAGAGEGAVVPLARAAGIGAGSEGASWLARQKGYGEKGQQVAGILGGTEGAMTPEIGGVIADSRAANVAATNSAKTATQNAPFLAQKASNINYVEGMNANAENMKQSYNDIYDKASDISQGVMRNEPEIQKNVSALLDNLKDDPAHQGAQGTSQAYRDMAAVKNSFDEDGNVPLDSITLLQRRVNDLYSPDMAGDRKAIYNALNTQLRGATQRAAVDLPEWGAIQDAGNKLFANYKNTYINDKATDPIWSAEDKMNYEGAKATNADPYGSGIDTATRNKLYSLTSGVKNLAQYESMMRKLPPEMQDQFTQDVISATKADSPNVSGRIYAAYKAAKGNPYYTVQTAKNLYNAMKGPADMAVNPSVADIPPHVEDATAYYRNQADKAYQDYYTTVMNPRPNWRALPSAPDFRVAPNGDTASPYIQPPEPKLLTHQPPTFYGSNQPGGGIYDPSGGFIARDAMPRTGATETPETGSGIPPSNPVKEVAQKTLMDIAGPEYEAFLKNNKGFKRGGAVRKGVDKKHIILTPAQIKEVNKNTGRTRMGRKVNHAY